MRHIQARTLCLITGLLFVIALAGFCFNRAGALALPVDAVSITLRAPSFESDPGGGLRLVPPEGAADTAATVRAPVYSTDVDEGQPVLPHQLVTLILPPDADLDSLALELEGAQVELAPGKFEIPLAAPKVLGCAAPPVADTCAGPAAAQPPKWSVMTILQPSILAGPQLLPVRPQGAAFLNTTLPPSQAVTLMPYGQLRKWKLAHLDYQPFRYDPSSGGLTVTRQVTARVTFRRDPALLDRSLLSDTVMDEMAPQVADNYAEARSWYDAALAGLGGALESAVTNDYLIITTQAIYDNSDLGIYMQYLREHGHSVTAFMTSRYGGKTGSALAEAIRAELKQIYASWGLTYVLLVGEPNPYGDGVPMRFMYPDRLTNTNPTTENPQQKVPTDLYYADLTGNWDLNGNGYPGEAANTYLGWAGDFDAGGVNFSPTLYVGRIPVYNNDYAALDAILQKLIDYQSATGRPTWRNNALLANSYWGVDYDGAVLGHLIDENQLDARGIAAYRIYSNFPLPSSGTCIYNQVSSFAHDAHLGNQVVKNYWSANPVGLMVWSGHGNVGVTVTGFGNDTIDCWHDYLFDSNQAAALNNYRPAFTYQNSCLNGYPEEAGNLGYSLLANGAVSTVSASRVTWLDSSGETEANLPTTYTSAAGKGYQYVSRLMVGYTAGEALEWADSLWPVSVGNNAQNNFDFNLYGDPAMVFYVPTTTLPAAPSNLAGQLTSAGGQYFFHLEWQDHSISETYFRITLSPTDASTDTIVNVERNRITTNVPVPACGKTYDITVRSAFGVTVSDPSNVLTLTRPCPPPAPTFLYGYIGDYHVQLIWDDVSGETGYRVMRRTVIGNLMTQPFEVASLAANITTFTDTSAACYHTYIYTIVAFNTGGSSLPSPAETINSPMCAPPAPSNLAASAIQQTGLTLTWTDNSSGGSQENGFEIWRIPSNGSWSVLAVVPADSTSYTVTGLKCSDSVSYWYRVAAYNNGGRAESAEMHAQPAACSLPAAPSDLAVEDGDLYPGSVQLGWIDNSDNEWGFKIEKLVGTNWELVATVGVNETGKQITGLSCSGRYSIRIYAYNGAGNSSIDGPIFASTAACDENVPENFQGSGGPDGITLTWVWRGGTFINFEIQRAGFLGRMFQWSTIASPGGSERSYLDKNVTCGNHYYYRIRSVPTLGGFPSAYTPAMLVQNLPCPPAAPGFIRAQGISSSSILVYWRPSLSQPVDGYQVWRKLSGPIGLWGQVGTTAADVLTYTDTRLHCGTSYDYRVSGFNLGGEGAYSASDTASTVMCAPAAPSGLVHTEVGPTGLALAWTDNSSNEDGFILQRLDPLNGWADILTTPAGDNNATDSGLSCGTLYTYRVLAFNLGGESAPSPELETGTRLCQPQLSAQAGLEGLVTLTWKDLTAFPVAHLVERMDVAGGWIPIGSVEAGINSLRDLAAPCGATLTYHVAGSISGSTADSPWSNPASAVTTCAPTTVLTLETGQTTAHSISLTWKASYDGAASFVLERSADGTFFWEVIAKPSLRETSFLDTGLPAGRRFSYRLTAVNAGGQVTSQVAFGQTKFETLLPLVIR